MNRWNEVRRQLEILRQSLPDHSGDPFLLSFRSGVLDAWSDGLATLEECETRLDSLYAEQERRIEEL